ncbi:hypothetical protein [Massilia sp. TS11]|nr:hypothetical protein [Massilia sp. TS11]
MQRIVDFFQNLFSSSRIDADDELMGPIDLSDPYCASLVQQLETQ